MIALEGKHRDEAGDDRPCKKQHSQGKFSRLPQERGGDGSPQHGHQGRSMGWQHSDFAPYNYRYYGIYMHHMRDCSKRVRDSETMT